MEGTATLFIAAATVPAVGPDASVDAPPAAVSLPASPPSRRAFPAPRSLVPSGDPPGARARAARVPSRAPSPARSRGSDPAPPHPPRPHLPRLRRRRPTRPARTRRRTLLRGVRGGWSIAPTPASARSPPTRTPNRRRTRGGLDDRLVPSPRTPGSRTRAPDATPCVRASRGGFRLVARRRRRPRVRGERAHPPRSPATRPRS